jgi:hypothetical protein
MPRAPKPILNSAVAIARLLNTEGFTDHVANECERYYRRNSVLTDRQKRSLASVERAFSKMVQEKLDCWPIGTTKAMNVQTPTNTSRIACRSGYGARLTD